MQQPKEEIRSIEDLNRKCIQEFGMLVYLYKENNITIDKDSLIENLLKFSEMQGELIKNLDAELKQIKEAIRNN